MDEFPNYVVSLYRSASIDLSVCFSMAVSFSFCILQNDIGSYSYGIVMIPLNLLVIV